MPAGALSSIYLGGILHLGWAGFHLLFPKLFKWPSALADLDPLNRGVYQVLNLCLTFCFAALGALSLVFAGQLLATSLGRTLLALVGVFWLFRLGLQFKYFKPAHPVSILLSLMFALSAGAYFYPLLKGVQGS